MFRKALLFAFPLTVSTLSAQWVERPYYRVPGSTLPAFQITPYVGYIDFGRYINGPLGQDVQLPNGPIYRRPSLAVIDAICRGLRRARVCQFEPEE